MRDVVDMSSGRPDALVLGQGLDVSRVKGVAENGAKRIAIPLGRLEDASEFALDHQQPLINHAQVFWLAVII